MNIIIHKKAQIFKRRVHRHNLNPMLGQISTSCLAQKHKRNNVYSLPRVVVNIKHPEIVALSVVQSTNLNVEFKYCYWDCKI